MDPQLSTPTLIPTKPTKKTKRSMSTKSPASKKKTKKVAPPVCIPAYTTGKNVTVTGYAGGSSRTKKAIVVAFVPAGENIFKAFANAFGFELPNGIKNMEIRFGRAISHSPRYIVRENRLNDAGKNRIATFYSPVVANVERQNGARSKAKSSTPKVTSPVAPSPTNTFGLGY